MLHQYYVIEGDLDVSQLNESFVYLQKKHPVLKSNVNIHNGEFVSYSDGYGTTY